MISYMIDMYYTTFQAKHESQGIACDNFQSKTSVYFKSLMLIFVTNSLKQMILNISTIYYQSALAVTIVWIKIILSHSTIDQEKD